MDVCQWVQYIYIIYEPSLLPCVAPGLLITLSSWLTYIHILVLYVDVCIHYNIIHLNPWSADSDGTYFDISVGNGSALSETVTFIMVISQWTLKHDISWHHTNNPDFDILMMSNSKYHMGINTKLSHDMRSMKCNNVFSGW